MAPKTNKMAPIQNLARKLLKWHLIKTWPQKLMKWHQFKVCPVSEDKMVFRSIKVYQRGKLLTLEQKTGTLLKLGDIFQVTLIVVNELCKIGNVIWVKAFHYFQAISLMIGGNFIHN